MNAFDLLGRVGGDARDAVGRWPVVTGLLTAEEFAAARLDQGEARDLRRLDRLREGAQMALSLAGVEAASVCVAAPSLSAWCDLTGRLADRAGARPVRRLAPRLRRGARFWFRGSRRERSRSVARNRRLSDAAARISPTARRREPAQAGASPGAPVEDGVRRACRFPRMARLRQRGSRESTADLDSYALLAARGLAPRPEILTRSVLTQINHVS